MRDEVHALLVRATRRALEALGVDGDVDAVPLQRGKLPEHGDFASSVALARAKQIGRSPRELAERIAESIDDASGLIARVEIAGPGFLNVFLAKESWRDALLEILRQGERYGRSDLGKGERVQVEFVSANPTGPLTIGHARNAVLGDCIARLFDATGHDVTREYYFNDAGRQMRVLAASLRARYEQELGRSAELPEEGYEGAYLIDVAKALRAESGEDWLDASEEQFKERAKAAIFADIQATLERMAIRFDTFYNEQTLYDEGLVEAALEALRSEGLVYERDGAVWLRSESLGLSRDRVLVKSSGEATYLLPDIAYHLSKFRRGFQRVVDVLGPDHIEQFPYVRAAASHLGCDGDRLELAMYQWVNLRSAGEVVKMSTRKASFVTVDDLLSEVGPDVLRYFMVDRRAETHIDFDLDLARERSERNPVYKIQYAHARLSSIERTAAERGCPLEDPIEAEPDLGRLESPAEAELAKTVARYPSVVESAALGREPQEVARYLLDLANQQNAYVADGRRHRVLSDDSDLTRARLVLVRAVRMTLRNGLGLLGIAAPERM